MISKSNQWKREFLLTGFCFAVVASIMLIAEGQVSYNLGSSTQGTSTTSSDRAYCIGSGYLYRTDPAINNGQGFCQFDGSWCDAHAFATGSCGASTSGFFNPYGYYYPYYYSVYYPSGMNYSTNSCSSYGGSIQTIHTPYGDVDRCILPNGNVLDLNGLYDGYLGDSWYYWAYSFLNAP
jgi:putative hemolysin